MTSLIHAAAIAVATLNSTTASGAAGAVLAAPATVPVAAPAPSGRRTHDQQAITVERPASDELIQQQLQFRVVMPAYSGDGGG